jgi:predicted metalloprotease
MPGKESMEKALGESNLKLAAEWLNNQYGIVPVRREITIRNPEDKKVDYGDFLEAYYTAQEGYEKLESDEAKGIAKLQAAIALWQAALKELDMDDKKARINKKVAPDLYLNLIEACIFAHEFETAEELISATRRLDFAKRDMDDIAALKEFLEDFRVRF